MFDALLAAVVVSLVSLCGVLFFGHSGRLTGIQRFAIPAAVGVFLSLIMFELVPETLALEPKWGGVAVVVGFIAFYVLSGVLHKRYHDHADEDCDRKAAAMLLLVGDAIHNVADGVILGGAFLLDPTVGVATAVGLALHEIPQEILEFGVLVRGGFSRGRAAILNLISASGIIVGTAFIFVISAHAEEYIWILTGIAAGNLLYLAASDLLPRIHGNLKHYGSIWQATTAIVLGFLIMTTVLEWTHDQFGHGHDDEHAPEYLASDDHFE